MIIAGGNTNEVEILIGNSIVNKRLPNLPDGTMCSLMFTHNTNMILFTNQKSKKCFKLDYSSWKYHSTLKRLRWASASVVSTNSATFIFGGFGSLFTYEYLPKNCITWKLGKTKIPGGFEYGCAIEVKSKQEIWLIGGLSTKRRILSFNIKDHSFKELSFKLAVDRGFGPRCAFIPGTNKVIVTGGADSDKSSEILDIVNGTVSISNPTNYLRSFHGIGDISINGQERLAVFGGRSNNTSSSSYYRSIEVYDPETQKWKRNNSIKLDKPRYICRFLNVKLADIYQSIIPKSAIS